MVTFTCSGCNESMKKAKVEVHLSSCRRCEYVTCIDCMKDFTEGYKDHTSCISENQKYGAAGEVHKDNKGDVKQNDWVKCVRNAANDDNLPPKIVDILKKIEKYSNVPRKKGKFINFLENSLRLRNSKLAEEVYNAIPQPHNNPHPTHILKLQDKNTGTPTPVDYTATTKNAEVKAEKESSKPEVGNQKEITKNGKLFSWNKTIKRVLVDAPENELPIKKLRKRVLREYKKSVVVVRLEKPELKDKFLTKVSSCKKFTTVGDNVQLTKKIAA